jgi:hypothetical protein
MPYIGTPPASELANLDINGQSLILDADADTHITADTDDQIDIAIAGADDFQFTANTFTAQSGSTITTPTLGVVNTKDLGSGIHIKTADSGASVNADEDELVIEGSGNVGMAFLGSTGSIVFGDSGVGRSGRILYDMGDDYFDFGLNTVAGGATSRLYISSRGAFVGDVTNAQQGIGMTLNQGANDDMALALKSSDIAHGMTGGGPPPAGTAVETDTYFFIQKSSATLGGASVSAFAEDGALNGRVLNLVGYGGTATTAKSTSGHGVVSVHAGEHNGSAGRAAFASNSNLFSVSSNDADGNQYVQFIVDLEGDIHYNGSDAGAYDEYEDAQLTRALDLSQKKGIIDSKFDKFIAYNHEKLAELELVGREENGEPNHFVNLTGMQRLHNGAIWQQYEKHHNLLNAVYELAVKSVGKDEADAILEKNEVKLLDNDSLLN